LINFFDSVGALQSSCIANETVAGMLISMTAL